MKNDPRVVVGVTNFELNYKQLSKNQISSNTMHLFALPPRIHDLFVCFFGFCLLVFAFYVLTAKSVWFGGISNIVWCYYIIFKCGFLRQM